MGLLRAKIKHLKLYKIAPKIVMNRFIGSMNQFKVFKIQNGIKMNLLNFYLMRIQWELQ